MKKRKILTTLIAVLMLVLSMSMISHATEPAPVIPTPINSSFIIKNESKTTGISLEGKSFALYRIFDMQIIKDADEDNLKYFINKDFEGFFVEGLVVAGQAFKVPTYGADDTDDEKKTALAHAATEFIQGLHNTSSELDHMQALVTKLKEYVDTNKAGFEQTPFEIPKGTTVETASDKNVTQTMTAGPITQAGYYLILDTTVLEADDLGVIGAGALQTFPSRVEGGALSGDVTISLKGSAPTVDKKIWHDDLENANGDKSPIDGSDGSWDVVGDYQIGDTVEYRIKVTVPSDLSGYDTYDMVITDTLSSGLTLNKDVTLFLDEHLKTQVGGAAHTTVYDMDKNSFVVTVDALKAKANVSGVTEFYIYYTAIVTKDAVVYPSPEKNKVTLEYRNNPYVSDSKNEVDSEVYSYTFDLDILKTKGDAVSPLANAVFALYSRDGEGAPEVPIYLEKLEKDGLTVPTYYPVLGKTPSYPVPGDDVTEYDGLITTDDLGKFKIIGLNDELAYCLKEVEAPDKYNPANDIWFTIHADYTDKTGEMVPDLSQTGDLTLKDNSLSATIVNTSSALLPSTGGIGSTIFLIVGAILMSTAIVLLFMLRKKDE